MAPAPKLPVSRWYWLLWLPTLALGLFVFYVVLTPVWMALRLVAWCAEEGMAKLHPGRRGRIPAADG